MEQLTGDAGIECLANWCPLAVCQEVTKWAGLDVSVCYQTESILHMVWRHIAFNHHTSITTRVACGSGGGYYLKHFHEQWTEMCAWEGWVCVFHVCMCECVCVFVCVLCVCVCRCPSHL